MIDCLCLRDLNSTITLSHPFIRWQASKASGSSRSQMFFTMGVLKNFAKSTGKHLCCSLFNKVAGLKAPSFTENIRQVLLVFIQRQVCKSSGIEFTPVSDQCLASILFLDILYISRPRI